MYTFLTLLFGGALLIGYLWGGPDQGDKIVMSLGAGARNIPAALLVAVTNFPDHRVAAVVIIGSLVEFVLLLLFAKLYGRKRNGSSIAV
jgi:predicted Na+-dependent transporter